MPEIVDARMKKFFEDPTLPRTAVFAVRFTRDGDKVVEHYANLYFWKKLRHKVGPLLAPMMAVHTSKKNWSITLVKQNQHDVLKIVSSNGLSTGEAEAIKSFVASKIGAEVDMLRSRGRERTLPRDEHGKAIYPKKVKPPKTVLVQRPNSIPVKVKISMQAKPKERPIKTIKREFDKLDREAQRYEEMEDPLSTRKPEDGADPFRNCASTEAFIIKNYERPAHALSDNAWSLFWQLNGKKLPSDFIAKYKTQLEKAQGIRSSIGAFASLQCALSTSFLIHGRVMLERPDYFQKLIDLGCKPDDLGTVTWNSVTHAVDVSGSVYLNGKGLTRLPFQFGKVSRSFWCSHNQLTSLKGCPEKVGGHFYCSDNQLTSLDGAPEKVGGNFGCTGNRLMSLDGAPEKVGGNFGCSTGSLTDVSALRGCKIKGGIYLFGLKTDRARVTELLMAQGFKGEIR